MYETSADKSRYDFEQITIIKQKRAKGRIPWKPIEVALNWC